MRHAREMAKLKQDGIRALLDFSTKNRKGVIDTRKGRIESTVAMMIGRNQRLEYQSRKRAVFNAWRSVAAEQRKFFINITRVCQKSFMAEGFERIHEAYVKNRGQNKVYRMFNKWFNKFQRDDLRVAMSRWKLMAHRDAYE